MVMALDMKKVEGVAVGFATLLSAVAATSDGEWVNAQGLAPFSVHVTGITDATVRIHGSNKTTAPANADAEEQLGSDITATTDTILEYSAPMRWIKASIPTYVGGTITAELVLRNKS